MSFPRFLVAGLLISVLLHSAGSAYFAEDPNEISIAASQGGGVSVIGSLEDMVMGNHVESVEPVDPIEEVELLEEPLEEIREPVEVTKVEPPVTADAVQPVQAVNQPVAVETPVMEPVTTPVVAGVTSTDTVTSIEPAEEIVPEDVQPLTEVKPDIQAQTDHRPVEIAKAVQPEVREVQEIQEVQEPVIPETVVLEEIEEPLDDVTKTPVAKPKPPVETVKKETRKKPVKQAGTKTNSRKGGERITSNTARSNANGRADAKTNDGGTKATSNYKGKVVAKLRRAKKYPSKARRKNLSGIVQISFTIAKNGSVSGVQIARSSGHQILDQAALDMVRRASPMPKFPSDIRVAKMTLQVPVRFDR